MIIIEGPDGGGKTTLVKRICEEFDLPQGQRSERDRDKIYLTTRKDSWAALTAELDASQPPLVWDRMGPFSDPIYSSLGIPVARPCAFTANEIRMYHKFCHELALVIVCMPKLEVLKANTEKGHQLPGVAEQVGAIWRLYMKQMSHFFFFDYTRRSHNEFVLNLVKKHLLTRKSREALCS